MLVKACAKINLGLNVVGLREDGYHCLETVLYPVPLADELRLEPALRDELHCSGIPVEGREEDNLVWRAVRLLRGEGYAVPPLRVSLHKRIPSGAGLGGGSSDAVATVKALNEGLRLGIGEERMRQLVVRLGADCPFFVEAKPAFAEGIGDVLSPVGLDLGGLFLVLIKPSVSVSTREAYSRVKPALPEPRLREATGKDIGEWRHTVRNDFEESVFPLHPEIGLIKQQLYSEGALFASMTGSGSAVFGLFQEPVSINTPHFLYASPL
ncbi:MAG: 4-(cytidine 5'-diphospho)-2-C-methyl-D-erythritol kinase [Prevotellaceae bacterium]|nr:4-(cytidine 5'-diphospho)-2-C-methyl-D-erythritol kinase [Prevotellaceae bacterium]